MQNYYYDTAAKRSSRDCKDAGEIADFINEWLHKHGDGSVERPVRISIGYVLTDEERKEASRNEDFDNGRF